MRKNNYIDKLIKLLYNIIKRGENYEKDIMDSLFIISFNYFIM